MGFARPSSVACGVLIHPPVAHDVCARNAFGASPKPQSL